MQELSTEVKEEFPKKAVLFMQVYLLSGSHLSVASVDVSIVQWVGGPDKYI